MGVITYSYEFTSTVAPARLFTALVVDSHNLLPKIMPQAIKSIEILEGDGGVGTIREVHFPEGSPTKYAKYKTIEIDAENYVFKRTMIEGDGLSDKFESVVHEYKIEATSGGCVCKITTTYYTKIEVSEETLKGSQEKCKGIFLFAEQHLVANPDLYA